LKWNNNRTWWYWKRFFRTSIEIKFLYVLASSPSGCLFLYQPQTYGLKYKKLNSPQNYFECDWALYIMLRFWFTYNFNDRVYISSCTPFLALKKSWFHSSMKKFDFEEQVREKKRWDNIYFYPNLIYGPLDHLKRFLARIDIIITMKKIEQPNKINYNPFLGLNDKIYAVHRK
jgi:hypothetical protein